jgi:hypothetical protein
MMTTADEEGRWPEEQWRKEQQARWRKVLDRAGPEWVRIYLAGVGSVGAWRLDFHPAKCFQ